jgi:oligoribonuclease
MLGIFLDTETNGLNPNIHRVIEIAYKIIDLYSGEEKVAYDSLIFQPESIWEKSNLKSLEINGLTIEELQKGKKEKVVSAEILNSFEKTNIKKENSVFICQNPSFDRAFFSQIIDSETQNLLNWPYHWLDLASMYWSISLLNSKLNKGLFPWLTGFSKDLIASVYNLPAEKKPHRALNGVNHLILCYKTIVGYPFNYR